MLSSTPTTTAKTKKYQSSNPYAILQGSPSTCDDESQDKDKRGFLEGEEFSESEYNAPLSSSSDLDKGLEKITSIDEEEEEELLNESLEALMQDDALSLEGVTNNNNNKKKKSGPSSSSPSPPAAAAPQEKLIDHEEEWQTCLEETPQKSQEAPQESQQPQSSQRLSSPRDTTQKLEPEEDVQNDDEYENPERYYELTHPNKPQRRLSSNSHASSMSSLTFDEPPESPPRISNPTSSERRRFSSPVKHRGRPLYPPVTASSSSSPYKRTHKNNKNTTTLSQLEFREQKSERLSRIREKVEELQAENAVLKQKNRSLMEARSVSHSTSGGAIPDVGGTSGRKGGVVSSTHSSIPTSRLNKIYEKVQSITAENESLKQSKEDMMNQIQELQSKLDQQGQELKKSVSLDLSLYGVGGDRSGSTGTGIATVPTTGLAAARQKLDMATESVFSRVKSIAETRNALAKQREQYFSSKKYGFDQPVDRSSPSGNTDIKSASTGTGQSPSSTPITAADRQKANGLVITRKLNRSDRRVAQLTQRIAQLEYEQMEDKRKIDQAQKSRHNDLEKITQLELDCVQQRTLIATLQHQVKQKDQSIEALEDRVQDMGSEMMDLRELHELEQEELQNAYEELKSEAAKLVSWLKSQLAEYQGDGELPFQGRDIPFSIDRVQSKSNSLDEDDESDLESLTPSEKRTLLEEIEQERNKWHSTKGSVDERVAVLRSDMLGSNSRTLIPELNQTFDSADEPSMF